MASAQDYEKGELLGSGTFAEVYKAVHKQARGPAAALRRRRLTAALPPL